MKKRAAHYICAFFAGCRTLFAGSGSSLYHLGYLVDRLIDLGYRSRLIIRRLSDSVDNNAQMQDMMTAMEDINRASESISKIIKVIDDIAFQTNINITKYMKIIFYKLL